LLFLGKQSGTIYNAGSIKATAVSLSSAEAEIKALTEAIENAYLEAPIDKEIYMYLPDEISEFMYIGESGPGPRIKKKIKVKILKSFNGLKQAGELWNEKLNSIICSICFSRCYLDNCCVYCRFDPKACESVRNLLAAKVTPITDLGNISKVLGISIERDTVNNQIKLMQTDYIQNFIDANLPLNAKPKSIPLSPTADYRSNGDFQQVQFTAKLVNCDT
jgi:hypothetical protein